MAGANKVPPASLPGYDTNGPWFYNSLTGRLAYETGVASLFYKLATHAPGDWYGWKTSADALHAISVEGWPAPTSNIGTGYANATTHVGSAAAGALGLPQFQNTRDLAVRAVKVLLGGALVIVGLNMVTHASQALSNVKVIPL